MGLGTFMLMQMSIMTGVAIWYAKRHPSDAMQMFMKFRSRLIR